MTTFFKCTIGSDERWMIADPIRNNQQVRFISGYRNLSPIIKNPKYTIGTGPTSDKYVRIYYYSIEDVTIYSSGENCRLIYIKKPLNLKSGGVGDNDDLTDFNDDVYHELVESTVRSAIAIATPEKSQVSQQQFNNAE